MKVRISSSGAARDFSGAMTDISFLLIIFFLVTTVFMTTQGILIKLPEPDSEPRRLHPNEVILVKIISEGKYLIDRKVETDKAGLQSQIEARFGQIADPVLVINVAGDNIVYEEVLDVLEISKSTGISSFSIQYNESEPMGLRLDEGVK